MEITNDVINLCERSVGELVAEDYRRAGVFKRFGIDYCCGGEKSVKEACEAKEIACEEIVEALEAVAESPEQPTPDHLDVRSWAPDFLASFVVNIHHNYVREQAPVLRELTRTVARVHGATHPHSIRIAELTEELTQELAEHMSEEEQEYFPYIEAICTASRRGQPAPEIQGGSLEQLEHEHDRAGTIMKEIRTLSGDFDTSVAPCNTSRLAYIELEKFEADLHKHVHLENNILFPAVVRLEQAIARRFSNEAQTPDSQSDSCATSSARSA